MTTDHLARARDYIAKGDDYHRKAAEEIVAAKEARPELTWVEIGRSLNRSESWVRRLVAARNDFLKTGEFQVSQDSGSNKRDEVARKVLRNPEQRREVIESLTAEERTELVREVAASAPSTPVFVDGDTGEVMQSIQDAPNHDLSSLTTKFVTLAFKIECVLGEGAEFRRVDATALQRFDSDLDRVKVTADNLKAQIAAQGRVRRVA